MGDKSKIEWTDASWNPTTGCQKVSEGCRNCYAINTANRLSNIELTSEAYKGTVRTLSDGSHDWTGTLNVLEDRLDIPLKWKRPRRVFVNSMSDLFHESVPFEFIDKVFAVMALCPQHTFQILTKRPDRMFTYIRAHADGETGMGKEMSKIYTEVYGSGKKRGKVADTIDDYLFSLVGGTMDEFKGTLPNVWLGGSAEDQSTFDDRADWILSIAGLGWHTWFSLEPLLGPIELDGYIPKPKDWKWYPVECRHGHDACPTCDNNPERGLEWIVVGGESGQGARPMHPDWALSLRDHCSRSNVAFFFKQYGEYLPVPEFPDERICVGCGCTEYNACINNDTGEACHWLSDEEDRCSACKGKPTRLFRFPDGTPMVKVGKHTAGHLLAGVEHFNYPEVVNAKV
jgi:protein gp37